MWRPRPQFNPSKHDFEALQRATVKHAFAHGIQSPSQFAGEPVYPINGQTHKAMTDAQLLLIRSDVFQRRVG